MTRGVETPVAKVEEFRAHYLYSGNAKESAGAVGIPERTGRDIARHLVEDESFAADRRALRESALNELVAMRMRVAQKALSEFESDLVVPESFDRAGNVTIIDKRADFGKLVLEAEKNAHNLARYQAEKDGQIRQPGEVTIRISGPDDQDSDDPDGEAA